MDKDKLRMEMIKGMPDSLSGDIKENIADIILKVMEAVDGESVLGTVIALEVLKDLYACNLSETVKEKFGEGSEMHKMAIAASLMASDDTSGTVH